MTRYLRCPGYTEMTRACLLYLLLMMPILSSAMELDQLHEIEGIGIIDARMRTVFDAYGLPAVMIACEAKAGREQSKATWKDTQMEVSAGDWEVIYLPAEISSRQPEPMWRNPHPVTSQRLDSLSRLTLKVQGKVGDMIVRRRPQKTTYEVSLDPLLSHKVISVRQEYKSPVPIADLITRYGDKYDSIDEEQTGKRIRYWVLKEEGNVPVELYAVDFILDAKAESVIAAVAHNSAAAFVDSRLKIYFERWEKYLYD